MKNVHEMNEKLVDDNEYPFDLRDEIEHLVEVLEMTSNDDPLGRNAADRGRLVLDYLDAKTEHKTTSNPTPGPFVIVDGTEVYTENGAPLASGLVADDDDKWHIGSFGSLDYTYANGEPATIPYAEECANARLFTASPEMLKACSAFLEWESNSRKGYEIDRSTYEGDVEWHKWHVKQKELLETAIESASYAVGIVTGHND